MIDMPNGPCAAFFVVLNLSVERGYPGDALSTPREAVDFTVHRARDAASARLLAELDLNLAEEATHALRRSFLAEAAVPDSMCADGSPHRWIADRTAELLRRAGAAPGAYASAMARGQLAGLLADDLADAVRRLRGALGREDGPVVAAMAMEAAGAAARAARLGAAPSDLARRVTGAARAIGTAAWAGEDVEHLAPALDALLAGMPMLEEGARAEAA